MNSTMPDNSKQPLIKGVNESLNIIRNASKGSPTGGSSTITYKTEELFDMFHINRK